MSERIIEGAGERVSGHTNAVAGIIERIPGVLTEEAPRDLNAADSKKLEREREAAKIGKLVADLLENVGVETESRTLAPSYDQTEPVEGWTVLDPEDFRVNKGVFLARNGVIRRLWHTRYESWDSTFMHECDEGSSEALWILESEQFQHGVAQLIATAQKGNEIQVG